MSTSGSQGKRWERTKTVEEQENSEKSVEGRSVGRKPGERKGRKECVKAGKRRAFFISRKEFLRRGNAVGTLRAAQVIYGGDHSCILQEYFLHTVY